MSTRFLAVLPLLLLLGIVVGVGYSFWEILNPEGTPTPPSPPPPTPVVLVSLTPSPPSSTSSPTFTPLPIFTPTVIITPDISTPTPPPIYGVVTAENLNVRWGPGTDYGYVGAIYKDDRVIILGRNVNGAWLKIETLDKRTGWTGAKYVETSADAMSLAILPAPPLPPASPIVSDESPLDLDFSRNIDIEGRSVLRTLGPYEEHWYTFFEEDPETVVVFMFKPNINFDDDHFIGYNIEFFLHDQRQIPIWPPSNVNSLSNIGSGKYPGIDRDGDLSTGELVWRGGPLIDGVRYYLRFVNRTPETITYCLAPGDVYHWTCPKN